MTCDQGQDGALPLSAGLFGAPASQAERDRETRAAERDRTPKSAADRD